jgi:hypothetical protein
MRAAVERLQAEVSKLPQYEPDRALLPRGHVLPQGVPGRWRAGGGQGPQEGALLRDRGDGTVCITTDEGAKRVTGPAVLSCAPGTKRAVYSETPVTCLTFHIVNATTVEEAERELVEDGRPRYVRCPATDVVKPTCRGAEMTLLGCRGSGRRKLRHRQRGRKCGGCNKQGDSSKAAAAAEQRRQYDQTRDQQPYNRHALPDPHAAARRRGQVALRSAANGRAGVEESQRTTRRYWYGADSDRAALSSAPTPAR